MKKVLVVDNDRFMRDFLESGLSKEGYEVLTAEDGLSALDILKTYTPDVIFVDLVMPNIDGMRLCKILRGMDKLNNTYIVILSSIAAEEQLDIAELGVNACIAKGPFHEMAQNIISVMDQSNLESAQSFSEEVIGIETSYPQEITKEFLYAKRHFELILEKMSEGIVEITSEGRIIYANITAVTMIRQSEEKLLGSLFVELFPEDDRTRINELLKAVWTRQGGVADDTPVRLNEFQVTLNAVPIEGNGSTAIIILSDTAGRESAAQAQQSTLDELNKRIEVQADQLAKANKRLRLEIENRKGAEEGFQKVRSQLEAEIRELTSEFSKKNELRKKELESRKGVEATLQVACEELKDQIKEINTELSKKDALLNTEIANRKQAEAALENSQSEFENRIRERTSELSEKNRLLEQEMVSRKGIEVTLQEMCEELKEQIEQQNREFSNKDALLKKETERRKRAAHAAQEGEERIKAFVELLPEATYEMDTSGNLTFASHNTLDRFGYTHEDFDGGLNGFDMVSPQDRDRVMDNAKRILRGETLGPEEYNALRKDGTTFPAMHCCVPILREGEPVGLRGVIMEIGGRKPKEPALPEAREGYRPLLELRLGDQKIEMDERRDNVKMGRDPDNDLVLAEKSASRFHALIANRGDRFVLIDQSRNGTYIHIKGKQGLVVKQNEYPLSGSGVIGLGCKVGYDSPAAIWFRVHNSLK